VAVVHEQDAAFRDERVLWTGRPTRYPVFDRVGVLLTVVGGYCLVGAAFSIVAGIRSSNSLVIILAALIALCVLIVVIGRILLRRTTLRSTSYRLTESQLVSSTQRGHEVANLRDLAPPTIHERDGSNTGTIRFEGSTIVLLEIDNVRLVHQLIKTARADLT
jgi:hypothetical protein